jgi:suppressor for copper-sensitivity B
MLASVATVAAIGVAISIASGGRAEAGAFEPAEPGAVIDWKVFDRDRAEQLSMQGTPVFVDVTADWCLTCKVNEALVLETREVGDAFRSFGVVAMRADWTNRDDEITRFLQDHGRYGIPFYLLYEPGGNTHLFGELITKSEVISAVERAAGATVTVKR